MRIIVTRPEREARRWAAGFAERGHDAVLLPLIDIAALQPGHAPQAVAALGDAWRRLGSWAAVMFVSAPAVDHFFAARPPEIAFPAELGPRFWAPGPGTAKALRAHGVPDAAIDGPPAEAVQFDSERLWAGVGPQIGAGAHVLFVRGGDAHGTARGRDWLAQQVLAAGGTCEDVVAYERRAPAWSSQQLGLAAAAATDGSVWLFSSSEAIANLAALLPGQDWRAAVAVATHPRIAQAARDAGFGVVRESRPAWAEVVASIESKA